MYTLQNTIHDIQKNQPLYEHFSYIWPREVLAMVPEELRDFPLGELKQKLRMPWDAPYLAEEVVRVANAFEELQNREKYEFVQLWTERQQDDFFPSTGATKEGAAVLLFRETLGAGKPMVLLVPGGAYQDYYLLEEGLAMGKELAARGYAVAILNYRCAPATYPAPQLDLALAVRYLRFRGQQEKWDGQTLLAVGFSAGGHLVGAETLFNEELDRLLSEELRQNYPILAAHYEKLSSRADQVCLAYPVIDFVTEQHEESFQNLSGADETLREKLSLDRQVTGGYPKAFLWACEDDTLVPASNARRMYEALREAGCECIYRTYPTGGHGAATGRGTSAEGWIDEMVRFMKRPE